MTNDSGFNRRTLLQLGTSAAALLMVAPSAALAAGGPARPDQLAAWIRAGEDGRISISIGEGAKGVWRTCEAAEFALPRTTLGPAVHLTAFDVRQGAVSQARAMLIASAARAFGSPPQALAVQRDRITHEPTGRDIGYRLWVSL